MRGFCVLLQFGRDATMVDVKRKRFKVVVPAENGGVTAYPMYTWLRDHPDELPSAVPPTSLDDPTRMTSRMLRSILTREGWTAVETPTEVRLIPAKYRGSAGQHSIVDDAASESDELAESDVEVEEVAATVFRMEQQLQHFVADNLAALRIDGRPVHPFEGSDGRSGLEFSTPAGRIDLLARNDVGGLVVFEFKRARAADAAIGQLTRYMGYLSAAKPQGQPVAGVIVAPTISDELRYSARMVPNVHLFEFALTFTLKPAQDVPKPA